MHACHVIFQFNPQSVADLSNYIRGIEAKFAAKVVEARHGYLKYRVSDLKSATEMAQFLDLIVSSTVKVLDHEDWFRPFTPLE